jgi:hypothetical protein
MRETFVSFTEITAKRLTASSNHEKRALPRREILRNSGFLARALASLAFIGTDLAALFLCFGIISALFENRSIAHYWTFYSSFHPCVLLCIASFVINGLYPGLCMAPAEELKRYTQVVLLVNVL